MRSSNRARVVFAALACCLVAGAALPARAQFTADGVLDDEVLLVPTIVNGRVGYAAFVIDTSNEGADPLADGFRDGALSPTLVPPCIECQDAANGRLRTPFGTGKLTVIYLMDSDGIVDPGNPATDDSVLYVGMDIANGDPRIVGGHAIDVEDLNPDFGLCNDGVPDLDFDGQADTYMIPFDADGDGNTSIITRGNEHAADCLIQINEVTGDLTDETYELEVFSCVGSGGVKITGDRLFLLRLTMEEGVGNDIVELKMLPDVNHRCTDFGVAEVTGSHDGLSAAQLTAMGQNPDFGRDIEFLVKRIDSLVVTAYGSPYPACTDMPDYREVRFMLADGGVSTLSGAIGDLSEEDVIEAPFTVVAPEIEVTKKVRCVGDPEAVSEIEALPGSTVEFVIDVENTGNVDLAVTLNDLLDDFGPATATVDPTYLNATLYRPADGSGIVEDITVLNAGGYGLNAAFFTLGGSGSAGFLGGIIDGQPRYMGVLQAVTPCMSLVPGDKMELVFRVMVDAPEECDGQVNPDIRNKITATGDPDIPPVSDGDEVTDAPGNVPLDTANGIDTYREKNENTPASDDNVADVQILCRSLTFDKQVRYVSDCDNPPACDNDTGFGDTAVIPPGAPWPICLQYRYTITNAGEIDEIVDLNELYLANHIASVSGGNIEFGCDLPLIMDGVLVAANGGTAQVCCTLKFNEPTGSEPDPLDEFLNRDDAQTCNEAPTPGFDDPDCYSNCAQVTAEASPPSNVCDSVGPITLYDYATFCRASCSLDVTKEVACIDDCGGSVIGTFGPSVEVVPGSKLRFKVTITNPVDNTDICKACKLAITDLMSPSNNVVLCADPHVSFELNGGPCTTPAGFNVNNTSFDWLPSDCGVPTFDPGDELVITWDAEIPIEGTTCNATDDIDASNTVTVAGFIQCPDGDPAFESQPATVTIDVKCVELSCVKEWSAWWDANADCDVEVGSPSDGYIDWSCPLDLSTADGGEAIIFPAILCQRVTVTNNSEIDLDVTVTDSPNLPTPEADCELGDTKRIAAGASEEWLCCFRVDSAEEMRQLAANDGGTDAGEYEVTATASGTVPSDLGICPGLPRETSCSCSVIPTPTCSFAIDKNVVCIDCATGNEIGTPAKAIEAGVGACVRYYITIENTSSTVKIPRIDLRDTLTPSRPFDNCVATLRTTGDVSACVCGDGFNITGAKREFVFGSCLATDPWIAPGETLTITFDVDLGNADLHNTVHVTAYPDACEGEDNPCADADSNADVDVKIPGITCEKLVRADFANGESVPPGANNFADFINIDTGAADYVDGTWFPITLTYKYIVTNTGELDLDAQLCDAALIPDALAAGADIDWSMCDFCDADPCTAGDTCIDLGTLAPSADIEKRCEIVFATAAALGSFPCQDELDPTPPCDYYYVNTSTAKGTPDYDGICPPAEITDVEHDCGATVHLLPPPTPCPETKAVFYIWDDNELMYGGTERCITAWDQRRLSRYTDGTGIQNLFNILQTDHARARIDGDGNEVVCPGSEEMPLLGVLMKIIQNPTNTENYALAGMTLWGSGYEAGRIIVPMFEEPAGKSLTGVVDATAEPSDSREQQVVDATLAKAAPVDESNGSANVLSFSGERVSVTHKGSLLVFPDVELRWDDQGNLIQDTIISLNNDANTEVNVNIVMVNGDPIGKPNPCDIVELVGKTLTMTQPVYWSAANGQPFGGLNFSAVGPGIPDDDEILNPTGGTVLRGYILVYAVNTARDKEIRWNHLHGEASIVHYGLGSAWEYNAYGFQAHNVIQGEPLQEPWGQLDLDENEYDTLPDYLLMDLYRPMAVLDSKDGKSATVIDEVLTLWLGRNDLTD